MVQYIQNNNSEKSSNKGGHGEHFPCSEGYNFNIYKKYLPPRTNSQGREQLHAKMDKFAKSLIYFDYLDYMNFMKIFFFGLNNLKAKGEIDLRTTTLESFKEKRAERSGIEKPR